MFLLKFFFHYESETDDALQILAQKYCFCLIFQSDGGLKKEKHKNAFESWRACLGKCSVISAGDLALKFFPLHLYDPSWLQNAFVQVTSAFILIYLGFCFCRFSNLYNSAFHTLNSVINSQIWFKSWPALRPRQLLTHCPTRGAGERIGWRIH